MQLALEEPEAGPWRVELLSAVVGAAIRRGPGGVISGRPVVLAVDGRAVSFRPPRWAEHDREGCIEVPADCPLLVVEGVGAGRLEVTHLTDALIWVQSDDRETERRVVARDRNPDPIDMANIPADGPPAEVRYRAWMAEEIPFNTAQRTWERAGVIVCGTPQIPCDPVTEIIVGKSAAGSVR